ncbi:hypothetical protein OEZ85_001966 [Tetradesmus obliquus]|uniref:Leucine-rich repeat-containing N-terminal plant-type domain-containing protein n=1 Tax=Tetradesmus obliquus TaxID=3088 RepID=A0ABY8U212_TETOB|nr:hypothetical protein OEZ85_001966 [Tetradesmus obliquus]
MRGARAPCLCLLLLGACSAVQAQFDLFGGLTGLTGGLINTGSSLVTGGTGLGTGFSVGGLGIGTPVYTTPAAASAPAAAAAVPAAGPTTYSTNNLLGWLFPVFTPARRDNCVVYEGSGSETVQTVSRLFGLDYLNVLADNQGSLSSPNQPLAGRSILLCGRNVAVRPAAPVPAPIRANAPTATAVKSLVPPATQAQALLQFKAAVDPANAVLKDWSSRLLHCTWVYVTCDRNQNIIRLNMVYLGLAGKLPDGNVMKNLPHLTHIYLGGNLLKGTLPASWGTTLKPVELFLNDNQLEGPLPPQWGSMSTLKVLSLPYNQFTGGLPPQWGAMTSLLILKLNNNKLRGGVPQTYGNLKQISTITIFNNPQMAGCVPEAWSGKSKNGVGYFQSPSGTLSDDIKDATRGTAITGFCCKGWRYCV